MILRIKVDPPPLPSPPPKVVHKARRVVTVVTVDSKVHGVGVLIAVNGAEASSDRMSGRGQEGKPEQEEADQITAQSALVTR